MSLVLMLAAVNIKRQEARQESLQCFLLHDGTASCSSAEKKKQDCTGVCVQSGSGGGIIISSLNHSGSEKQSVGF